MIGDKFGFVGMETIKSIDECFSLIQNGANIKQGIVNGGYPITRIETISNDKFNRDKVGFAGIYEIDKYENYVLEDEDLLMSHINSPQYLGRTVLYEKQPNEIIIHGMNLLRLKANRNIINPRYARYIFYSRQFRRQIVKISKKSVNQASFAVTDLKKIKIKLPSIEKQKCIVEILDLVNNTIEKFKNELGLLDELIKARFVEMFGNPILNDKRWRMDKLKKITYKIGSGATPKGGKESYVEDGISLIRSMNVHDNRFIYNELAHITDVQASQLKNVIVNENDVLFNITGASITRTCIVPLDVLPARVNQHVCIIRPDKNINAIFLCHLLQSNVLKSQLIDIGESNGATRQAITKQQLEQLMIICPPIELQNQFADFVKEVDKSKFMDEMMVYKLKM